MFKYLKSRSDFPLGTTENCQSYSHKFAQLQFYLTEFLLENAYTKD